MVPSGQTPNHHERRWANRHISRERERERDRKRESRFMFSYAITPHGPACAGSAVVITAASYVSGPWFKH